MLTVFLAIAANELMPGEETTVENGQGLSFTVGICPDGTRYMVGNNPASEKLLIESGGTDDNTD